MMPIVLRIVACCALLTLAESSFAAEPAKLEPMRGAKSGEPGPARATLLVGANETVGGIAEPGWLIIVSAAREPDDTETTAPALPDILRVKLTDGKDAVVALAFQPVSRPGRNEADDALYWIADESATEALTPGRYRVALESADGDVPGWRIDPGLLEVVEKSPERAAMPGLLKIQRALLIGDEDQALAEAAHQVGVNAGDEQAWIAKGDILMMKDDPDGALKAYDSAFNLRDPADGEPLPLLERRRAAFFRGLEKRGAIPPDSSEP